MVEKNDELRKALAFMLVLIMVSSGFFVAISDSAAAKSSSVNNTDWPADMGPVREKTESGDNNATVSTDSGAAPDNGGLYDGGSVKDPATFQQGLWPNEKSKENPSMHRGEKKKNGDFKGAGHHTFDKTTAEKYGWDSIITPESRERQEIKDQTPQSTAGGQYVMDSTVTPASSTWHIHSQNVGAASEGTSDIRNDAGVTVHDVDKDANYSSIQEAIDNTSVEGAVLQIYGTAVENITINKTIEIVDSSFDLYGNIYVKDGAVLDIDPSWVNMSGNWYIDAGTVNVTDNTVVQFNCSYDGEFGIQVNASGTMIIQNGSTIQSNGTAAYWFHALQNSALTIRNSTVKDCGWNETESGLISYANSTVIFNSTFANEHAGIVLSGVNGAKIENSTFNNTIMGGIGLINGSHGNYIANNTIDGGEEGIHIEDSSFNIILNNHIGDTTPPTSYGTYVEMGNHTNISNNRITAYSGIYMKGTSNNTIHNNQITFANGKYNGLQGYWKMDEARWTGAWGEVKDSSGNNNNGRAHGNAHIVTDGKYGNAGSFDGASDYVGPIWSNNLNTGSQLTVEAWVNLSDATTNQKIAGKAQLGGSSSRGYVLGVESGHLYPEVWDASGADYSFHAGNIPSNQWVHLAFTWQTGGQMIGYINGQQVASKSASTNNIGAATWNPFVIGAAPWDPSQFGVNGLIDEVKVFNRTLSQEEINRTYNSEFAFGIYMKDSPDNNISYTPGIPISGYGDAGIYLDNSSPTISYARLYGSVQGLVCMNGSSAFVTSAFIASDIPNTIHVDGDSHPVVLDTFFAKTRADVVDSASNLTVEWYLDAHVRDSTGGPIAGAYVNMTDGKNNYFSAGLTDASGHLGPIVLVEYIQNWTAKDYCAPYNVYADAGTSYGSETTPLLKSTAVYINASLQKVHDVEQDTWYPGINPAVIGANPGDHLEVYGGTHNETVLIDKSVHITGAVTPLPVVNGNGSGPAFLLTAEGVEISNLNITNTGTFNQYGIYATAGGFNIHDNVFWTQSTAIRVRHSMKNMVGESVAWGDVNIQDNEINAAYMGIVMDGSIHNLTDTRVSFGDYNISGNRISSEKAGIYMEMWESAGLNDGTDIDFGSIFMYGNTINASSGSGIYMSWTGAGEDMAGSSRVSLGDTVAIGNRINASSGSGIEIEDENSAYNMSGNSSVVFGSIDMSGNRILSTEDGLAVYLSSTGYEMHDTSSFEMGDISVDSNIVNSTGSNGIAVFMRDMGEYMYNYSTWFSGDVDIAGNTVLDTGGWGIVAVESIAMEMYGHSSVTSGSINVLENSVRNGKNGMAVACDESGENMFDNAEFASGDWNIMHNDVNVTNVGVEVYSYAFGALTYGNAVASRGNTSVRYNDVVTENAAYVVLFQYTGAYIYDGSTVTSGWLDTSYNSFESNSYAVYMEVYFNAAYLEDSSSAHIGNFMFTRNNISSNGSMGIYVNEWDLNGAYNSGNTYAEIGSFMMSDNNISTNYTNGGPGIYIDTLAEGGSYLMDFARASIGSIELNNNSIKSGDNGIYVDAFGGFGYDLSYDFDSDVPQAGSCRVTMGHVEFNGNTIESNATGIGIDELGYIGSELYGSSTFSMGNFEVMENGINARDAGVVMGDLGGGDGIMEFGYDLHDYSKVTLGGFLLNNNTIDVSNYAGIYVNSFSDVAEEMYGYSEFTMGDFEISYNKLSAPRGDGIYLESIEGLANEMYDHSTAEFGDFRFNWNTVTNASEYGFYSDYIDYLAYDMYNSSTALFGNFEFNNNSMHSNDSGIEVYNTDWGENMYGSSQAYFGDIRINDNRVNTTGANNSGIDMGDWGGILNIGYGLYGNAYLEVGNIEALRNLINTNLSGAGNGIEIDIDGLGNNTHGNSVALFHDFLFGNNTIDSGGNGILFSDFSSAGSGMYDYSSVTLGNIEIDRNTIHSEQNGTYFDEFDYFGHYMNDYSTFEMGDMDINNNTIVSMSDGVYFEPALFGAKMHYGTRATIGSNHILNNTIVSAKGEGIYSAWWRGFGYEMYENSYLTVGDAFVCGNNISASGNGAVLLFEWTGSKIYDAASADFGNYTASHNTVSSDDGVGLAVVSMFSILELGPYTFSTSNSHVAIGNISMEWNNVTAPNDVGVVIELFAVASDIGDGSWASIGDMDLNNNTVDAMDGIDAYMMELGENVGGTASVGVGSINISGNQITADNSEGAGLMVYLSDSIYNIQDSASFEMDDIQVFDNTVTESYDGIYIRYDTVGRILDDAYARIPGVYAHHNSIIAHDAGVYIKEANTLYYSGGTQEWGMVEIYSSTVNARNGTHIEGDTPDARPDIWIHDMYFGHTGSSSIASTGIYDSKGGALFESCTFDSYREGIYASDSNLTVGSSDFKGVSEWDINMTNAAYVFMVDDNFNKTNVLFNDNDSILDIGWYITINVITQTGNGVPYADVTYTSNTSAPTVFTKSLVVDANGQYLDMLREYRQNITGIIEQYNNYNMTGSKAGLTGWLVPDPTPIDASKDVFIVLTDNDPPVLGADTSDTAGTTGDPFTFRVEAADTVGMDHVTVYYRFGSSGAYSGAVMNSSDDINWNYTMNLPTDFVGNMEYYFVATDLAGNVNTTSGSGPSSVPVTDNDEPYGLVDNSAAVAYGPTYEFNMNITDNINVTSVTVTYWFDSENHTTVPMTRAGGETWTYTIDLNCSWNSVLHYYFTASDAAGNVFNGSTTDVPVNDIKKPLIIADNSDTAATTGDTFHFSVNATDNFEIGTVTAIYWFGNGSHISTALSGSGTYTGTITIDSSSTDSLHYYFNVTDAAGNYNVSDVVDVNVTDNDLPEISDMTIGSPIKGSNFVIIGEVTDNVGVSDVYLEYWFDNGVHENKSTADSISDIWIFSVNVPEDAAQLHYLFHATDGTEWNSSTETVMDTQEAVDNSAPVVADATAAIPITGREFTFSAVATDDVGVAGVYVEYWFDTGSHTNTSMADTGARWEYTMTVPADTSELHYLFHAVDTSDNWASTQEVITTVETTSSDTELPVITDSTVGTPVAGMAFTISANVTDNMGVGGVYVEYWFDAGAHKNVSMGEIGSDWEYAITIPTDVNRLHYIISARDTSSNWNSSTELVRDVQEPADNQSPQIIDATTSIPIVGREFTFSAAASDNVAVAGVYVEYWFDGGTHANESMTEAGARWEYTMTVPADTSELHYLFHAVDTSDNWASTAAVVINVEATSSDTEAPVITDTTEGFPLFNTAFTFSADVTDNVGVAGVYVEYWFDDGAHENASMGESGSGWTYTITVPDGVGRMHYTISARDTSSNWNSTAEKELNVQGLIIDTEDPVIGEVQTSETPTEGEYLTFTVSATDNIGIGEVYVVYWTDSNNPSMALLSGENGTYTGTIAVPQGSTLHFYPVANDLVGNTAQGNRTDMDITPASSGGTFAPGLMGGTSLLLIIVIVILLLLVIYLAATRNKGGKKKDEAAGEPAASEEMPPEDMEFASVPGETAGAASEEPEPAEGPVPEAPPEEPTEMPESEEPASEEAAEAEAPAEESTELEEPAAEEGTDAEGEEQGEVLDLTDF